MGIALLLVLTLALEESQGLIDTEWRADNYAVRTSRYNRNLQNPGSPCSPSPCGENTNCMGNPICQCIPGFIPFPSPIDGCCEPYENPNSRVLTPPQTDPCSPTPCGPGTTCSVQAGNAICRCQDGFSPNPDTITGCKPECQRDPDCRMGFQCRSCLSLSQQRYCRSSRCVKKPDPCRPNPCGRGAECTVNSAGNAICQCKPGLIPKPDTITGCGPECVADFECNRGLVCREQRCTEMPDPCNPSPCGPGARCMTTSSGNAICRCEAGLVPKPDTITGCGPECVRDPDCFGGQVCRDQRCVERPDPCVPSPCGPGAECTVNGAGNAICRCQPGLVPNPDTISGCKPECVRDPDCQQGFVCRNQKCVVKPDPCVPSPCGPGAICTANFAGNPICRCEPGLIPKPDTITGCGPECVRDPDCQSGFVCQSQRCVEKPDPCDPSPCGPNTECMVGRTGNPICRCLPTYIPKPDTITGCGRECERDPDCRSDMVCRNYQCVPRPDPCVPSPCGRNTECNVNRQGNPVCTCLPGYSPMPDTIAGCDRIPEPRTPPPDPCFPSPCGPNTQCDVNRQGNPVCKCLPGFSPMPDTISGCERIDPCRNNGPCGVNAECLPRGNLADCKCPPRHFGDPYVMCRQGECQYDRDCSSSLACKEFYCRDPCPGACGPGATCEVVNHRPMCSCPEGYRGDPVVACERKIVIGGRHAPTPQPEPRNPFIIGQKYGEDQPQGRTRQEQGGVVVIGHKYKPQQQQERQTSPHVVGSKYNSGSSGEFGGCSRCGGGALVEARTSSGSSGGGGFVVVGSSRRRRNQQSFDLEPSQKRILTEDAIWSRILRERRRRMNISRFSGRTSPF